MALLLTAVPLAVFAACGDDDDGDNPELARVRAAAETAAIAYAEAGTEGLYDYLSANITSNCTAEEVHEAVKDRVAVAEWKDTSDVAMDGNDRATATITLTTANGDVAEAWSFVLENDSWRVSAIPGLEECT